MRFCVVLFLLLSACTVEGDEAAVTVKPSDFFFIFATSGMTTLFLLRLSRDDDPYRWAYSIPGFILLALMVTGYSIK